MMTTNLLSFLLFLCIILDLSNPFETSASNSYFIQASFPAFDKQRLSFLLAILMYLLHWYYRTDEMAQWAMAIPLPELVPTW